MGGAKADVDNHTKRVQGVHLSTQVSEGFQSFDFSLLPILESLQKDLIITPHKVYRTSWTPHPLLSTIPLLLDILQ
jgi:hypothetical protein